MRSSRIRGDYSLSTGDPYVSLNTGGGAGDPEQTLNSSSPKKGPKGIVEALELEWLSYWNGPHEVLLLLGCSATGRDAGGCPCPGGGVGMGVGDWQVIQE